MAKARVVVTTPTTVEFFWDNASHTGQEGTLGIFQDDPAEGLDGCHRRSIDHMPRSCGRTSSPLAAISFTTPHRPARRVCQSTLPECWTLYEVAVPARSSPVAARPTGLDVIVRERRLDHAGSEVLPSMYVVNVRFEPSQPDCYRPCVMLMAGPHNVFNA